MLLYPPKPFEYPPQPFEDFVGPTLSLSVMDLVFVRALNDVAALLHADFASCCFAAAISFAAAR